MSSGCEALDRVLDGGFGLGELTLVYGEAGTGKTTLAVQTAVTVARSEGKVIYVDSDKSFTPKRFEQISQGQTERPAERIFLLAPDDFKHQSIIIENVESYISPSVKLVVVDTLTGLYRVALSSDNVFALNRELTRQLAYLADLSKVKRMTVMVTSQVHAQLEPPTGRIEPVARRSLFHLPQTIIHLAGVGKPPLRRAIIERLRGKEKVGIECLFRLTEQGFVGADY